LSFLVQVAFPQPGTMTMTDDVEVFEVKLKVCCEENIIGRHWHHLL
jgi:hypothetical protein